MPVLRKSDAADRGPDGKTDALKNLSGSRREGKGGSFIRERGVFD
jgi:hypothetical protein